MNMQKRPYERPSMEVYKIHPQQVILTVSSDNGIGYGGTDDSDDGIYGD